ECSSESLEKYHIDPDKKLIILGFHFHCIEFIGRYMGKEFPPFTVMYQKNGNYLIEDLIKEDREKKLYNFLDRKNFVSVI
ncbi:LPS biosynthesis protein, partial [Francisella tularensis subsp. holarctica]|nr:LPS biosynthesis protein [Francisella tularensis subsp. holarctica]